MNPYFDDPIYRAPGDPPPKPADLRDLGPVIDPFKEYPLYPNDPMDWYFGVAFVAVPYAVAAMMGPAAFTAYAAVGPDFLLFGAGVLTSNILQLSAPAIKAEGIQQARYSMQQSSPFFGVPGYV